MSRLAGKTALVTAAGQGIGRATAELFAREGARVIATDIDTDALAQLQGCETRRLDVRDPDAITTLAAEVGAVDVLFNCAGYVHSGTILECDDKAWSVSIDLNVTPMYRAIRAFLPKMLEAGGGSIINIASVAAVKGIPGTVDTPSLHQRMAATGDYEAARKAFIARQPMGRLGTAEEIAQLALYLASDDSKFMTGQMHLLDGGWTA
jgi:2-keto-3-deoxy-L-fuconate dehydrogenase